MARKGRKRARARKSGYSQQVLLLLTGSALTLCVLSIMYGFLIRKSMADHAIRQFRVEVLNGTGERGLARKVAVRLMERGIDVFKIDNADSFSYDESILVGRKKNVELEQLGQALGCTNVIEELEEGAFVDATLIVGYDYRSLNLVDAEDPGLLE